MSTILVKPKVKKAANYLNNKDILQEIVKSKAQGKMTEKFAEMMMLLAKRYSSRGNFSGYTYREDMVGHALAVLCRTWKGFDETKYKNPFAFYTQCIKNSFYYQLNMEKKERDLRDDLLQEQGLTASFSRQSEGESDLSEGNSGGYEDDDWNSFFNNAAKEKDPEEKDPAMQNLENYQIMKKKQAEDAIAAAIAAGDIADEDPDAESVTYLPDGYSNKVKKVAKNKKAKAIKPVVGDYILIK